MPRTTIADTAASLLAEHRALAPGELGRLMRERGVTRAKDPARAVSQALDVDRRFRRLGDGRWAVPGQLLHGATLTHRFTSGEATTELLALTPISPRSSRWRPTVCCVPTAGRSRSCGRRTRSMPSASTPTSRSKGPPGWLADCPAGLLVHVRLTDGILRAGVGPEPRPESRLAVRRIVEAARTRLLEQEPWGILDLPPFVTLEAIVLDSSRTIPACSSTRCRR